jgi:hypothetical protein
VLAASYWRAAGENRAEAIAGERSLVPTTSHQPAAVRPLPTMPRHGAPAELPTTVHHLQGAQVHPLQLGLAVLPSLLEGRQVPQAHPILHPAELQQGHPIHRQQQVLLQGHPNLLLQVHLVLALVPQL